MQDDQLNLFFDQLTQQEGEQLGVIRRLVDVFSEALRMYHNVSGMYQFPSRCAAPGYSLFRASS